MGWNIALFVYLLGVAYNLNQVIDWYEGASKAMSLIDKLAGERVTRMPINTALFVTGLSCLVWPLVIPVYIVHDWWAERK